MASRQGGVNISYLVVAIVICLGLVVFVVAQNSAQTEMAGDLNAQQGKNKDLEARIRGHLKELTQARELLHKDAERTPDYEGMTAWIDKAGKEIKEAEGADQSRQYLCVQDYLQDSLKTIINWRTRFENQKAAAENKDIEYKSMLDQREELRIQRDTEIKNQNARINQLQVEIERVQTEARATEEDLREELEQSEEELTAKLLVAQRQLDVERNLHKRTKDRLEHLREEIIVAKTFDKVEPDGEIVQVSDELGFAWINIGQGERVTRGTVFDVFSFVKGGKRLTKGKVEVVHVDDNMSKVAITGIIDALNPFLPGDKIASPFYAAADKPVFVIAGDELRSRRLSLEELGRKINKYGGTVEDSVRIETSYVIAIAGYETSPAYKDARELGITILREEELLGFIGY